MEFTFITLTWNSERYINDCINSIMDEVKSIRKPFEIYIIDNGSHDSTVAKIRNLTRLYQGVIHPIFLRDNIGTTKSRNMALLNALGRYIVILDSDLRLLPGVLDGLRRTLQNDASLGLVAPRLIYPNGNYQKSIDSFPSILNKLKRYILLKKMEREEDPSQILSKPIKVDYAISAFWMLPRLTIDKVGLLDEKYFYSPEDADYCLRIWNSELSVLYNPLVKVIHHSQEISREFKLNVAFISHVKGLFYYFCKHRYIFKKPVFSQSSDIAQLANSNRSIR